MSSDNSQMMKGLSSHSDFTETHYAEIIAAAKQNYVFTTYDRIKLDQPFVLWRHDVDISINRARRLAVIESEHNVVATYFINIHSEFYNCFEASQSALLKDILDMGHRLGLHFDANYYHVRNEASLDELIAREAELVKSIFGANVDAFSFHDPSELHLSWMSESYAGILNCYSRQFRESISYCSDSNGYWRYKRLIDQLTEGKDPRIQVLTHPGLWQRTSMAPRERLWRAAYGRASAVIHNSDKRLAEMGRVSLSNRPRKFGELSGIFPSEYVLWDILWNEQQYSLLLISLYQKFASMSQPDDRSVMHPGSSNSTGLDDITMNRDSAEISDSRRQVQLLMAGIDVSDTVLKMSINLLIDKILTKSNDEMS